VGSPGGVVTENVSVVEAFFVRRNDIIEISLLLWGNGQRRASIGWWLGEVAADIRLEIKGKLFGPGNVSMNPYGQDRGYFDRRIYQVIS
jgi:hypothetical protein